MSIRQKLATMERALANRLAEVERALDGQAQLVATAGTAAAVREHAERIRASVALAAELRDHDPAFLDDLRSAVVAAASEEESAAMMNLYMARRNNPTATAGA